MHLLVLDSYDRRGREELVRHGAHEAGALYAAMLRTLEPEATVDVAHPADGPLALPHGASLGDYDGLVWTGSSLSVRDAETEPVRRQLELVRAVSHELLAAAAVVAVEDEKVQLAPQCTTLRRGPLRTGYRRRS